MPTLTARTLFTDIGSVAYPVITVDAAGQITDISSDPTLTTQSILTQTFLDIHIHGAAGSDVMQATPAGFRAIGRFLASHGTGHYLPTTVTASVDTTLAALDRIATEIEQPTPEAEAIPIGIHLEGPFLSHLRRGVHAPDLLQPASIALFDRFQQAARGHIKLLTCAPELPGACEMIAYAVAQGVRVSMGHTNATAAEAAAGIAAGASSATHTFNGMRPLDHREPGILGTVLDDQSLYAEIVCDGVHVTPTLVRLWQRLKGDRALLITDAMSATGMPDGAYELAGLPVTRRRRQGHPHQQIPETIAGSVLTLDRAVENFQSFTGCTFEQAIRAATLATRRHARPLVPRPRRSPRPTSISSPPQATSKPPTSRAAASPPSRLEQGPTRHALCCLPVGICICSIRVTSCDSTPASPAAAASKSRMLSVATS